MLLQPCGNHNIRKVIWSLWLFFGFYPIFHWICFCFEGRKVYMIGGLLPLHIRKLNFTGFKVYRTLVFIFKFHYFEHHFKIKFCHIVNVVTVLHIVSVSPWVDFYLCKSRPDADILHLYHCNVSSYMHVAHTFHIVPWIWMCTSMRDIVKAYLSKRICQSPFFPFGLHLAVIRDL